MTGALLESPVQLHPGTRHLLSSEDLDRATVDRLLELAASFEAVAEREVKKLPTLRGRTVLSVFFEASTRTSSSFELAAKRLSADTISLKSGGSSVEKGETLKDTLLTLDAYGPDVVVIRHAQVGAAALATRYTRAAVVNAGDGAHQHPTQSLLDLYTMRAALGRVEGVHVAIVGDVLHSRVARSNLALLLACGAHVTLIGPPSLIPRGIEATGVVGLARHRRHRRAPTSSTCCACSASACCPARPTCRACASTRCATASPPRACGPGQVVMHPGPMNRGVEITRRGGRLGRLARHAPGARRARRADGRALRPARGPGGEAAA